MRNIDRLQELLNKQDIPSYRKEVDLNGKNLGWIKKHVKPEPESELYYLINMNVKQLSQEHRNAADVEATTA